MAGDTGVAWVDQVHDRRRLDIVLVTVLQVGA